MAEPREGVIRYRLSYTAAAQAEEPELTLLCRWHSIFQRLGWLGQDPKRYGGDAYGNLSVRTGSGETFLISGTQTGATRLGPQLVCRVTGWDIGQNVIEARGPVKPSSEALTHAAAYALDRSICWVFHIHEPTLWQQAQTLGLPVSDPAVAYGTPAMAMELNRLYRQGKVQRGIICMGGHRDGVIAMSHRAENAASELFRAYASAVGHAAG